MRTRFGRLGGWRRPASLLALCVTACAGNPAAIAPGAPSAPIAAQDRRACPVGVTPAARLEFADRPAVFDDTTPLARLSNDSGLAVGHLALGLTEVKLSLVAHYRIRNAPAMTEGVCAYADDLVLRLSYAKRVVHVAREFAGEPCLHAAIQAHEMRHVAFDDALIPREAAALAQQLPTRIGAGAGFWGATAAEADRRLERIVADADKATIEALDDIRRRGHARQVDTPDQEAGIAAACDGRLRQVLGRAR